MKKTFTIVKVNPNTGDTEAVSAHKCPKCGNIVECQVDMGGCHWIHCSCGETTRCGEGIAERSPVGVGGNGHDLIKALHDPEARCQCQDCGQVWNEDELDYIDDISMRIAPGEEVPAGQCPNCQALCHRIKPDPGDADDGIRYALADGDFNILTSPAYGHLLDGQVIVGDIEEARAEAESIASTDGFRPSIVKITLVEPGD